MPLNVDWIVPDWPASPRVRALCTTRAGGVSAPPYDSLNLGDHVKDEPAAVAANRACLEAAMGAHPVFLQQVHGCQVRAIDASTPDGLVADACVTTEAGVACTIMVADCLPVLLTDRAGTVVAAAHAGWRGLAGIDGVGVIECVLESLQRAALAKRMTSSHPVSETLAWLGPCIGSQAFEVGAEVREAFCATDGEAAVHFRPHADGKFLADLAGLARHRLRRLGVSNVYGNDGSGAWCTVGNPSRFFSFRRDQRALGGSGRFAACIWLD